MPLQNEEYLFIESESLSAYKNCPSQHIIMQ